MVPEWYAGNIYDMQRGTPQSVRLPVPPSRTEPTVYDVFVSGDYEVRALHLPLLHHHRGNVPASRNRANSRHFDLQIRLFGDPLSQRSPYPILDITLTVTPESTVEPHTNSVEWVKTHDVVPDFVDGWAFGSAVGVGLRSKEGWWNVKGVEVVGKRRLVRDDGDEEVDVGEDVSKVGGLWF